MYEQILASGDHEAKTLTMQLGLARLKKRQRVKLLQPKKS